MFEYEFLTQSQDETEAVGSRFAGALKPGDMVAMYGNLGAGKTAFTRGVLHALGYEGAINSPTFAIVNEYRGKKLDVAHFDLYRIGSEDELYGTGFYDYLDGRMVVFMEWTENVPYAVSDDAIILKIEHCGENSRRIHMESPRELIF